MTTPGGALIGQWLGEYQLHTLLGVGGMAEVYQARDAALGREVAVKVLPLALAADPTFVERFRNEARAVGALNHPNIVPVHSFGEQGPLLYLVMPLMKESLRNRLQRGFSVPVAEAVRISVQILDGLSAAHAQGVVHRDVKPENILLDEHGVAKLTDFGIARRITIPRASGGPTLAGTGLPAGTPQYMAPEQLRGEEVDQRADVYSLAAVLYEMLTGMAPHVAETPYKVASLVLTAPIVAPSLINEAISSELEQVMLKALSRTAVDRYTTASSFAKALQDALLFEDMKPSTPASLVAPPATVRTPPQLSLGGDGLNALQGNGWLGEFAQGSEDAPTVPFSGAPPGGSPPRRPPSNRPGGGDADGEGPGRRILILALIGALVVLSACAGVAYFMGAFAPGAGPTVVHRTATSASTAEGELPTETLSPTTTTGPGTPTSTPAPTRTAPTRTALPGATASATAHPGATATATSTPASPTLSVPSVLQLNNIDGVNCVGTQTITNNGPQMDRWSWAVKPSTPLPSSFRWGFSDPPGMTGVPQAAPQEPQGYTWTIYVRIACSDYTGPYLFRVHDIYGNNFPTSGDVTMTN